MIDLDMIRWITTTLRNNDNENLSDYSLEYSTALLMNLSLRTAGKDKCEERDLDILRLLNDLMEHDNLQVRT